MATLVEIPARRRKRELLRLGAGSLLEMLVKAYGGSAAAAVALSDSETTGGKLKDAVLAVPTLTKEYHRAQYIREHRAEIQSAVDYLSQHQVSQQEVQAQLDQSRATLESIDATYSELGAARDATGDFGDSLFDDWNPVDGFGNTGDALGHLRNAWDARPSSESLHQLQQTAEQAGPLMDQVDVLAPAYYSGGLSLADNFASDEIVSTLFVMGLAVALAFLIGRSLGFWVRRGRPGLLAFLLHGLGARAFPRWYATYAPYSMSKPLYANTRNYVQRELVRDPEAALDEESFKELEEWFSARAARSSDAPRPR